jgi:hypothetical protein
MLNEVKIILVNGIPGFFNKSWSLIWNRPCIQGIDSHLHKPCIGMFDLQNVIISNILTWLESNICFPSPTHEPFVSIFIWLCNICLLGLMEVFSF